MTRLFILSILTIFIYRYETVDNTFTKRSRTFQPLDLWTPSLKTVHPLPVETFSTPIKLCQSWFLKYLFIHYLIYRICIKELYLTLDVRCSKFNCIEKHKHMSKCPYLGIMMTCITHIRTSMTNVHPMWAVNMVSRTRQNWK